LHNNQFIVHPLAQDVAVRMNGTDVLQVLLNLAVNGFQCSSQPHSVEIRGRILAQQLDKTAFKESPQELTLNFEHLSNAPPLLMLAVSDTGPGIPPDTLPKIFQPYFTTKSERQGTGLGLNIVHRLVKEAKGALHVQTQLGRGTTFTLYLPAVSLAN